MEHPFALKWGKSVSKIDILFSSMAKKKRIKRKEMKVTQCWEAQ